MHCALAAALCLALAHSGSAEDKPVADAGHEAFWRRLPFSADRTVTLTRWQIVGLFPRAAEAGTAAAPASTSPSALHPDYLPGGEAAAHPRDGDSVTLPDGSEATWTLLESEDPRVFFSRALKGKGFVYAYAELDWPRDEEGVICYHPSDDSKLWVNGELARETVGVSWPRDGSRYVVPVPLVKGTNRILLKQGTGYGGCFIVKAMSRADARVRPIDAVWPRLWEDGDTLAVMTDEAFGSLHRDDWPPLEVTLLAPGGVVRARKAIAWGGVGSFDVSALPDGPYEVRFEASVPGQEIPAVHEPWYKGSLADGLRRVLGATGAADPDTSHGKVVQHLARLIERKTKGSLDADNRRLMNLQFAVLEYEELLLESQGKTGGRRPYGFVRIPYTARNDGSTQFVNVRFPPGYDSSREWPLLVRLHGYNRGNAPYEGAGRYPLWVLNNDEPVIVIAPHGRGQIWYRLCGETDVLDAVAAACKALPIDASRIVLNGHSMGGAGTLRVAAHNPDVFSCCFPFAPKGFFTQKGWNEADPHEGLQAYRAAGVHFESLMNTPTISVIGDRDGPEECRGYTLMMQRWGYPVRYREVPGLDHDILEYQPALHEALTHRLNRAPPEVRVSGFRTKHGRAHWLTILRKEHPAEGFDAHARLVGPNSLSLETRNVAAVGLQLPPELLDPGKRVRVVWNGVPHAAAAPEGGPIELPPDRSSRPKKTPAVAGPMEDIYDTPFMIVSPTASAQGESAAVARRIAGLLVERWKNRFYARPRVVEADAVTAEMRKQYSLIVVGGAGENAVARDALPRLPFGLRKHEVDIDGQVMPVGDAGVLMVRPNPWNPERYILVVVGATQVGLERCHKALARYNDRLAKGKFLPIWAFLNPAWASSDYAILGDDPERPVFRGIFGNRWQFDARAFEHVAPRRESKAHD